MEGYTPIIVKLYRLARRVICPVHSCVMPLADDMESIIKSLEKECAYSDEEIEDMLKKATFRCHDGGVDITYENGVVDKFIYFKVLVHSSEAHKVRLGA